MRIKDLELENLLELLKKYELTELTLQEGRQSITLKRNVQQLPYISQSLPGIDCIAPAQAPAPVADQPPVQTPPAAAAVEAANPSGWHEVKAPLVGTFYRSPSPGAEPFVEDGDQVRSRITLHHRSHEEHERDKGPSQRRHFGYPCKTANRSNSARPLPDRSDDAT